MGGPTAVQRSAWTTTLLSIQLGLDYRIVRISERPL